MGAFGTYCGTEEVRYLSQVKFDQLTYFKDDGDATFNHWMEGTLIPSAEKFIDGYVNHSFGTPGLGTIVLDGSGKSILFLPPQFTPLIRVTIGSVDSVELNISDLAFYDQYIRYINGNFHEGKNNVVLYGSFGYVEGTVPIVPADVSYVCAQLCANAILDMVRRNMAPDLFASLMAGGDEGGSGFRALWAAPYIFTKDLKRMLDPYIIRWVDIG